MLGLRAPESTPVAAINANDSIMDPRSPRTSSSDAANLVREPVTGSGHNPICG